MYKLVWIHDIPIKINFVPKTPMSIYSNNQLAIHIVHERIKHIELDCHVVRKKYDTGIIKQSTELLPIC